MMKYKLGNVIGKKGGFGTVHECISEDGGVFAAKFLNEDMESDENAVRRFHREMQTIQKLNHPNIIKILARVKRNDKIGYVMPKFSCSLKDVLDELKGDYKRQYDILSEIIDGMIYLHAQGVIHRDLKPDNILYNSDTDIAISDMGLAKDLMSDSGSLTETGYRMGTYRYMSPEQYSDAKNVDERTDIYAFGKIMEDVVAGGQDYLKIADDGISYIIEKCTAQRAEKRFSSFEDVKNVVDNVYQVLLKITDDEEYEADLMNFRIWGGNSEEMEKLACHVLSMDSGERVEEFFDAASNEEIKRLEDNDVELVRELIYKLKDYYVSQGWPFAYTDTIGDLCHRIYENTIDPGIKAACLYTILNVGIYHNRYHVMDIGRILLNKSRENVAEMIELGEFLHKEGVSLRKLNIDRDDLPDNLKIFY